VIYSRARYGSGTASIARGFDDRLRTLIGTSSKRGDPSLRAIILRIDSPGGIGRGLDAIWRELMLTKNERADRPIIASMSDLAASGGYYIATPAKPIVAQPSTLTGSIGSSAGNSSLPGCSKNLARRWIPRASGRTRR